MTDIDVSNLTAEEIEALIPQLRTRLDQLIQEAQTEEAPKYVGKVFQQYTQDWRENDKGDQEMVYEPVAEFVKVLEATPANRLRCIEVWNYANDEDQEDTFGIRLCYKDPIDFASDGSYFQYVEVDPNDEGGFQAALNAVRGIQEL